MLQLKWGLAALKGEVREERMHDKGGGKLQQALSQHFNLVIYRLDRFPNMHPNNECVGQALLLALHKLFCPGSRLEPD